MSKFSKGQKHIIWIIVAVLVLSQLLLFAGCFRKPVEKKAAVSLTMWGTYETTETIDEIVKAYRLINPKVDIKYRNFDPSSYEDLVMDEIAAGEGPDILLMHNTWLPKHYKKLLYTEEGPEAVQAYRNTFVDAATNALIWDGKVYGKTTYVDSLGLFYNKKHYGETIVRGKPASTWKAFAQDLAQLTETDSSYKGFKKSALAFGTANNISRAADMVYLLLLQNGHKLYSEDFANIDLDTGKRDNALNKFTKYADKDESGHYTWSKRMPYYIDAFAKGEVSTIVGYSYLIPEIESKGRAYRLQYDTAPMLQNDSDSNITLANYWALAISKNSKNALAANDFINYMTGPEGAQMYFTLTNRPPARRDLIEKHQFDEKIGTFVRQAISAKNFITFGDKVFETWMKGAINSVNVGEASAGKALEAVEKKINEYLNQRMQIILEKRKALEEQMRQEEQQK